MKRNPVVHFEMPYEDKVRVSRFYEKAFGWNMQQYGEDMGNYIVAHTTETDENNMVNKPGTINGGFAPKSELTTVPSVVISVEDIMSAMAQITEAGGRILGEPVEIPGIGKYVSFTDTEGNKVSLLEPLGM